MTGRADLARYDGQVVRAVGLYTAIAAPRKGPPAPGAPLDHAVLVLPDGTRVYLEAFGTAQARRPAGERARFDGRRIIITGVAHKIMPSSGQSLVAPCLSDLRDITDQP